MMKDIVVKVTMIIKPISIVIKVDTIVEYFAKLPSIYVKRNLVTVEKNATLI